MGPRLRLHSSRFGRSPFSFVSKTSCRNVRSTFRRTSETPKSPMVTCTSPRPSIRLVIPKTKRWEPVRGSSPTVPSTRPEQTTRSALTVEPFTRYTMMLRPSTIRLKYSGGPNLSAALASVGARKMRRKTVMVPAMNEANAEMPSAAPGLPRRAI
jgi:hypothetical protein